MTYEVGIQYTIFIKGGSFRQAYFNAIAPTNLDALTEEKLVDWASDIIKDMHPNEMIMIDAVNRAGRVNAIYDFEAKK